MAGAFFLSGAAALMYELLWFRLLSHVLGSTATATATLLAAYLFGLGLGAYIVGRISDRMARLPLVYIAVEIAVGLYGISSHAFLARGAALYALAHGWAGDSPGLLLLARFLVSFLLVAIPTTLMGGTFPLMVHLLTARDVDVGRATGRAYAINTAGAALGTLGLPFLLLPKSGVAASLGMAAILNLAAASLVFAHVRRTRSVKGAAREAAPSSPRVEPPTRKGQLAWPLLIGFFLSSFSSLALETVWTRQLSLFFGAQVYTFAFVLFAYLVGLFLGGAAYARLVSRGFRPVSLLRAGLIISAASVSLTLPFLDRLMISQLAMMVPLGVSHGTFLLTCAIATVGLVLPAALGFGIVFPAVVDFLARTGRAIGASVGLAYVVNTAGTTLGAIAAGFLLVPGLGSQRTLEITILFVAAALALARGPGAPPRRAPLQYGLPAVFLMVLVFPRWDWRYAHAGYVKDPLAFVRAYTASGFGPMVTSFDVVYLGEGAETTVAVCRYPSPGIRALFVNGKPDASDHADDMVVQRLLGCVPPLFHPDPKSGLVIGLGSGTTVATLARFPLETVEVAEISPEVLEAARTYFTKVNDRFFADPRISIEVDDGRNYLHFRPPGTYDIIVSEPSNPWMAGVSALFTAEFFADVEMKLRPGGIFCQWFHYYNMSMEHIHLLVRTFQRTFPHAAIFIVSGERPTGDILILGSNRPLRLQRWPDDPSLAEPVRQAFREVRNAEPEKLLSGMVASGAEVTRFAGEGRLNTDDLPILEFEAPADQFTRVFSNNLQTMLRGADRLFLPAVSLPRGLCGPVEIGAAGVPIRGSVPPGEEIRRGATVLTGAPQGREGPARWTLLGCEFQDGMISTGFFGRSAFPGGPAELRWALEVLLRTSGARLATRSGEAGISGVSSRGEIVVNGHAGDWASADSGSDRTIVVGWFCPEQQKALFLTRRVARGLAPPAEAMALDLVTRFPCLHPR